MILSNSSKTQTLSGQWFQIGVRKEGINYKMFSELVHRPVPDPAKGRNMLSQVQVWYSIVLCDTLEYKKTIQVIAKKSWLDPWKIHHIIPAFLWREPTPAEIWTWKCCHNQCWVTWTSLNNFSENNKALRDCFLLSLFSSFLPSNPNGGVPCWIFLLRLLLSKNLTDDKMSY